MPNIKQRNNLEKLAKFLDRLPKNYHHFRMASYVADYTSDGEIQVELAPEMADRERLRNCGTCACAIGHGPLAGIKPQEGEEWQDYEVRVFGIAQADSNWEFLFGPENPDDPKQAASRIRAFLAGKR